MAIYSSAYPTTVGPVRSARISDMELLRQYGRVAFAYSGVQSKMLPVLKKAYLIDVSDDHGGLGYHRDFNRRRRTTCSARRRCCSSGRAHSAQAVDVGFTFDDTVPRRRHPGDEGGRVRSRRPGCGFTWDASSGRWLAAMNGRKAMATEGGQLGGTTVIIQYVKVTRSIYHDKLGNYTPLTHAASGTGTALILRDGQYWKGAWSRPSAAGGTSWTGRRRSRSRWRPARSGSCSSTRRPPPRSADPRCRRDLRPPTLDPRRRVGVATGARRASGRRWRVSG